MNTYPVYTAQDGSITDGARVQIFEAKSGEFRIPAIMVGESGRGRSLGVLPVANVSVDEIEKTEKESGYHDKGFRIIAAGVGETHSGNPKLFAMDKVTNEETAIVVFRTSIGFRGGNSHDAEGEAPFPAILCTGTIAEGAAGRMGSGMQFVLLLKKGIPVSVSRSGRLYGAPSTHYYEFTGKRLVVMTAQERDIVGLPSDHQ